MTWFKLDDQVTFHQKTLAAGNEAFGAWCRAGTYSSAHGKDGFVPETAALLIAPAAVWERLVEVRFAHREADGWRIHDFLDWNPSAKETEKLRRVRASAGKRGGRASKQEANGQANGKQVLEQNESKDPQHVGSKTEAQGRDGTGSGSGSGSDGGAGGAPPPAPAQPAPTPETLRVLDALRDPQLQSIATMNFATRVEGIRLPTSRPVEWSLKAIADVADRATDAGWDDDTKRSRVLAFVTTAMNPRPRGGPAPSGTKHDARGRVVQGDDGDSARARQLKAHWAAVAAEEQTAVAK